MEKGIKINMLNDPLMLIYVWWTFHLFSLKACGRWFGVLVYPNGTCVIRDERVSEKLSEVSHSVED